MPGQDFIDDLVTQHVESDYPPVPAPRPGLAFAPVGRGLCTAWEFPITCPLCGEAAKSWCSPGAKRVGWACTAKLCPAGDEMTPRRPCWYRAIAWCAAGCAIVSAFTSTPGLLGLALGWFMLDGLFLDGRRLHD